MFLNQLKPKDFDFWTSLRTRWNDMDALGHVNHTVFLSYMETARVETYMQLGFEGINKRMDKSTILANIEVTYLAQLSHPSSLKIGHRIIRVGTKSYDLISGIFLQPDNNLLCSAYFKMVSFNYEINKTILVPDKIRDNCRPLAK
jgi:acyl-CoA thioester hydrolase